MDRTVWDLVIFAREFFAVGFQNLSLFTVLSAFLISKIVTNFVMFGFNPILGSLINMPQHNFLGGNFFNERAASLEIFYFTGETLVEFFILQDLLDRVTYLSILSRRGQDHITT